MNVYLFISGSELKGLEEKVKGVGGTILTPYITLDTPGKAQVMKVIIIRFYVLCNSKIPITTVFVSYNNSLFKNIFL